MTYRPGDRLANIRNFAQENDTDLQSITPTKTFFDLPKELRTMVYDYVFTSPSGGIRLKYLRQEGNSLPVYRVITDGEDPSVIRLSLLHTNKQLNEECKDVLWTKNEIVIAPPSYNERCTPYTCSRYQLAREWHLVQDENFLSRMDERIVHKIRNIRLLIDMTSWEPSGRGIFSNRQQLEMVCRQLSNCGGLKTMSLYIVQNDGSEFSFPGHEGFIQILEMRNTFTSATNDTSLDAELSEWREWMQAFQSFGKSESLAHVKKTLILYTGYALFGMGQNPHDSRQRVNAIDDHNNNRAPPDSTNDTEESSFVPYALQLLEAEHDPENVLLEMNKSLGGDLEFNGKLCCRDGKLVERATVPIGEIPAGRWWYDFKGGACFGDCFGNPCDECKPQLLRGKRGFQYREDLSIIFHAFVIEAISSLCFRSAWKLLCGCGSNWPVYPLKEMLPSRKESVLKFVQDLLNKNGLSAQIHEGTKPDFEAIRHRCIAGIHVQLNLQSDAVTGWDMSDGEETDSGAETDSGDESVSDLTFEEDEGGN